MLTADALLCIQTVQKKHLARRKGEHPCVSSVKRQSHRNACGDMPPRRIWADGDGERGHKPDYVLHRTRHSLHSAIATHAPVKAWNNLSGISGPVMTEVITPVVRCVVKRDGLRVTDLHSPFGSDRPLMQDDGIHPGRKDAEVMAGIVAEEIKSIKKDGKKR